MKKTLSRQEIDQRVAVLKRFKELLQEQRKKFSDYLVVLETQERSIHNDNIDALVHHTELEQSIIGDIFTIQKVIDPIEEMYRFGMPDKDDTEVVKLKSDLDKLQVQVIDQNKKNRELLQSRIADLRQEMISIKPDYRYTVQALLKQESPAGLVDISI
ncbi:MULTISPECIES: flagellar biosynthesis protein FlgN [unclassified Treponema]|uniref:flagellar biosynthesis protein FlgN n=1 Tax=unclassified Treponema TaxID=2638727 RepID=UPI0020A4E4EC|nr:MULTISPECIES: flagellar biosynthesis protein FlgN [unclassified Treponema]UTC66899.1 flagellar biosynthesis protein FlgN [Treponema sp. OMZ 789]UTC69628.1 flagellar biosynthesis protein FlgN [Treponema sp. OMZ 790]UTC72342.1 flagellar biosynthesis protein FlgN [Treponema sp. OMZ 791]